MLFCPTMISGQKAMKGRQVSVAFITAAILTAMVAWIGPQSAAAQGETAQDKASNAVVIVVSPAGNDNGPGTREQPFLTLERAQRAVRQANADHDVTVELGDGVYRL